jgi:hypothetical protein
MSLSFPAIPLSEYIRLVCYSDCAFWGVNAEDNNYQCRAIWSKCERDILQRALLEAQDELEAVIHYPLSARWFANERHSWGNPIAVKWGHIIEAGVMVDTMIQASVTVDYANDPAIVTVDLGACDPDNVHVFLPGTDIEIEIGSIGLTPGSVWPGTYDIAIPWCRLVAEDHLDNPDVGWVYRQVDNKEHWGTDTVDVRCIANDPSIQAITISRCGCDDPPCSDERGTGCIYIRDEILGFVEVTPATYANGVWTKVCLDCCYPNWVMLNYYAGQVELTRQEADTLIRLAHSKMASEPCGCDVTQRLWKRDRNIPAIMTPEQVMCPFGQSDGAWTAWKFATTFALRRGSTLFGRKSINAGRF